MEERAKEVQALRDGKVDKEVKAAAAARESLSKELVQATSELTNKRQALEDDLHSLETLKKVSQALGASPRPWVDAVDTWARAASTGTEFSVDTFRIRR